MHSVILTVTIAVLFSAKAYAGWGASAFGALRIPQVPTENPCESSTGWRESICAFAKTHLVHYAWGYEHGIRDFLLSMKLAAEDEKNVDEDVLFAAGLLHDIGGFPPYEKEGVDHAVRSTQVIDPILEAAGFPMAKIDAVKKTILTHSYYGPTPPETSEAIALHDADALDFLGAISLARILSIAGKEKGITDPNAAIKLLTKLQNDLPSKLYGGPFTKNLGKKRSEELKIFLQLIKDETFSLGLPSHN